MERKTRQAFTLIELLTVVAILGLLAALLLSAIQSARMSAYRLSCLNHMRQLAVGMQAYASREGVFPTAMVKIAGSQGNCFSAFTHILPELDQLATFNAINFTVGQPAFGIRPENQTVASLSLQLLLCPADGMPSQSMGQVTYRVNMGITPDSYPSMPVEKGAFELERWVSLAEFADGLSSTALLSERLLGSGPQSTWMRTRDPLLTGYGANRAITISQAINLCAVQDASAVAHYSLGGTAWFRFSYDQTFYNHLLTPNATSSDCSAQDSTYGANGASDAGIYPPRSLHSNGVNVALSDGSIRWTRDTIATPIWWALGTRQGNDITSTDE